MIFSFLFPIFGATYDFPYKNTRYEQTLQPGYYKFEVWGAQGGGRDLSNHQYSGYGGKGGYSVGYLNLLDATTVYVRVGGVGSWSLSGLASGGFNGGGSAYGDGNTGHGGGGGTDIRINEDDIYARVIVAGGGGGAEYDGENGGYGGGETGGPGHSYNFAGTQTGSYSGGQFFQGAHTRGRGAGGGGWYGGGTKGGSSTPPTSRGGNYYAGSGGSGYVYTSSTYGSYPPGCKLNDKYFLEDARTYAGNTNFNGPNGNSETGHSGNGFARITPSEDSEFLYIKAGNEWSNSGYLNKDTCNTKLVIKSTFNGANVISIFRNAFKGHKCITEVEIPSSIKEIGSDAFEDCDKLNKITFLNPSSLTSIGDSCFKDCIKLVTFNFPSGTITISNSCFQGCSSLQTIGDISQVTTIGDYSFQGCSSLQLIGDISQVTSIGDYSFQGCLSLQSIGEVWKGLSSIPGHSFQQCGIRILNFSHCFQLTAFHSEAFKDCINLEIIFFPRYLESIGPRCFENCKSLKQILLPPKITSIPEYCFNGCNSLKYVFIPQSVTEINAFALCSCGITSVRINPDIVVNGNAFMNWTNLSRVEIFDNTIIMPDAFALCNKIEKIVIYEFVTLHNNSFDSISPNVFYFGVTDVCPTATEYELKRFNIQIINVLNEYSADEYGTIRVNRCTPGGGSSSFNTGGKCSCTPYYNEYHRMRQTPKRKTDVLINLQYR